MKNHCRESSHILANSFPTGYNLSPETSEYGNDYRDIYSVLDELRKNNVHRVICSHININSIRYKIEMLSDFIKDKIDILCVAETNIDESFPSSSFTIKGFAPLLEKIAQDIVVGSFCMREDIPAKKQKFIVTQIDLEIIFLEIIIHETKWLIGNFYNPDKSKISNNLEHLSKHMDNYLPFYDNIILLGDFNAEMSENAMIDFYDIYNLKNLVKDPTCFKNIEHPSCIDLISTNRPKRFQKTVVTETGLSDFHKMTVTVLYSYFKKRRPQIVRYRDYKVFSNTNFVRHLDSILTGYDINNIGYDNFHDICMNLLNKYVPIKCKYLRANDGSFMNKELRKAVMFTSSLKNDYNKDKSDLSKLAYNKQRNKCTNLFRKAKRDYYRKLKLASCFN